MSRVFSYFFKNFFRASPTYASFSPLFMLFFAMIPDFPQPLVLSFPQHHNPCSRSPAQVLRVSAASNPVLSSSPSLVLQ
jgi:hypothetical protein